MGDCLRVKWAGLLQIYCNVNISRTSCPNHGMVPTQNGLDTSCFQQEQSRERVKEERHQNKTGQATSKWAERQRAWKIMRVCGQRFSSTAVSGMSGFSHNAGCLCCSECTACSATGTSVCLKGAPVKHRVPPTARHSAKWLWQQP